MTIQIDTREKSHAIAKIIEEFDRQGITYISSKLYVGDYMSFDNPRLIIDRKQNLNELCSNVCQGHKRFTDELQRAKDAGIKLIILCEHGRGIKCLADVNRWYNPRLKDSPKAVSGQRLFKILYTVEKKYGATFLFCEKKDTGKKIIEILSGGGENLNGSTL